jgi:Ca2+-binding EF-hand superfamily protein
MSHGRNMSAIVLFNQQRIRDRHKREMLVEAFRKADKNGDGRLSTAEIHGIYLDHGVDVTMEEVQKMVDEADKDGTGLLTEKEFMQSSATEDLNKEKPSDSAACAAPRDSGKQAEIAFRLYDKDKDGYITKAEMEKLSKSLSKEQIDKVFARFDADGDGRLSYAEFRKMMNK